MKSPKKLIKTSDLTSYDFQRLGHFEYNPATLKLLYLLERQDRFVTAGSVVYLWALSSPARMDRIEVAYVGSTDQNIYHRRSTWQSGLNSGHRLRIRAREENQPEPALVGRGVRMRNNIISALAQNFEIAVWVRISAIETVLGEQVPMGKVEEDALIRKFDPSWNWHGRDELFGEAGQQFLDAAE